MMMIIIFALGSSSSKCWGRSDPNSLISEKSTCFPQAPTERRLCVDTFAFTSDIGAPSDQSSGTSSPLCDSGLHLNYHPNNTDTLSCSSWPACPGLRWEKRWCDLRLIPLLHCRFSQYVPGTDLSRQNAFQVTAVDGVCSGTLQCLSAEDCSEWLQAIATNISNLTKHNVSTDCRTPARVYQPWWISSYNTDVTLHQLHGICLRMGHRTSVVKAIVDTGLKKITLS
ncbi:Gamma-1-syntrophin [Camelus dromedarius]|uniref:Gamma-1-syntrophin n=1 Tax=Camelus dromedarius TaxID=9838 RepID=A0A5N4CCD3_CAMDR|nr:Gamma-1-syntrophin [Camelus dromedarius]